jgi:Asp-tRNA(Asn)/Glu-tRNA(Gln) amidotransferase A subunit family amidase
VKQLKNAGAIVLCKSNVPWHLLFNEPANPVFGKTSRKDSIESVGGRCGALALMAKANSLILCFGTDQIGGLRLSAACHSLFSFKATSNRISWVTKAGVYDTLDSTGGPICSSFDTLKYAVETLMSPLAQRSDPQIVPLPFNKKLYTEALTSKKLTIGFFVDDQIILASPPVRRAVYNAAAKLHEKGHTLVKFDPPLSRSAFLLQQKMFANEKGSPPCLRASFGQQMRKLTSLFPMFTIAKLPKPVVKAVSYIFGMLVGDTLIQEIAVNQGGGSSSRYSRSLEEYRQLMLEKEEFCNLFSTEMESQQIDCLICPVSASPPAMGFISTPFTWVGNFYSSIFNLLDYPCGFVPNLSTVQSDDFIQNVVQYGHNDRYSNRSNRNYNFLAMMLLEEFNNSITDGSVVGKSVGVQVVGKPFQEETVLAVMKMLSV